ncbi:Signal transduction histidine kinase [Filimonas lacunae]|uniref:histidine kinase n=1 Tax=Filimonas lacunae TaxID=477680 RepID=A0A173MDG4_9BACT|nr:histidine kinase [Filimonas lacunae]BAV05632.1 two-component sensor histidine kinase [Filimonas lacunae]SIT29122.1 Signal transduction histidine kinase [Filimonas lacunae]
MQTNTGISIVDIIIPFTIVLFIIAVGVVLLYEHFQKNIYQQERDKAALKFAHQTDLLRNNILIQEEERKRIASDLHDELGAALSIIRMNLVLLKQKEHQRSTGASENIPKLENLISLSENAITSVRTISHQLMPPQLESFGLMKTLESFIENINASGKINICLTVKCNMPDLQWPLTLGLYRIIMELTNNTIKHAGASTIDLNFNCNNDKLVFSFTDNGKGLKATDEVSKGMGIQNIEARIDALKGSFVYGNDSVTNGFMMYIELPIEN